MAYVVMGVEILLKRIPQEDLFYKLRLARNFLLISLLMMTMAAVGETFLSPVHRPDLAAIYTLASGAFQCTCLVTVFLCLLNPAFISYRRSGLWLSMTLTWAIICGIIYWQFPSKYVIALFYVFYLVQISISLALFLPLYRSAMSILHATDKEHHLHLRWISWAFYIAAGMNFFILVLVFLPQGVHLAFNIFTIGYFIWFTTRFSIFAGHLFREYMPIMTEAGLTDLPPESVEGYAEREAACREKIEAWIAKKGYCDNDAAIETAAAKIGLHIDDLQWYCAVVQKEDFRRWRVSLRIEEAKRILAVNPDAPINELAHSLGFNSRSNFYFYFKQITGENTTEYIKKLRGSESQKL